MYSVFLKTLAHWKLAYVVTIPESLDFNDTFANDLVLLKEPHVESMYLLKSLIFSLTPTALKIPSLGYLGDVIKKLQKRNHTELEDEGSQNEEQSWNKPSSTIIE